MHTRAVAEPAKSRPQIDDPVFARAVELIDAGEATALRALLSDQPRLLSMRAAEDGSFAGEYFAQPRLLWFVAENPIRNGTVPRNIADVVAAIVDVSEAHGTEDLAEQLDYTLSLVVSGCVPRECGVMPELVQRLVEAGASAAGALRAALSHGELLAVEALIDCGAEHTLEVAAALGDEAALGELWKAATAQERDEALLVAAICGQAVTSRILLDKGANPNRYGPDGLHAHATPLHMAVMSRSISTVTSLITRGADPTLRDRIWNSTPLEWARHEGRTEVENLLESAIGFVPAVANLRRGDVAGLRAWLAANPDRVQDRIGDNPRTLLHYATDWPGHWPRVADSIRALVEAGAEVNARLDGLQGETPLHWAASSDDVDAVDVLLEAGADVRAEGGCVANGTPLLLSIIFGQWRAAARLVDAGARVGPVISERFREGLHKAPADLLPRLLATVDDSDG